MTLEKRLIVIKRLKIKNSRILWPKLFDEATLTMSVGEKVEKKSKIAVCITEPL